MNLSDLEPRAEVIVQFYEQPRAAMLPLLWLVQENQGYVSQEAEAWVARILGVARSYVREAVSFYNMPSDSYSTGALPSERADLQGNGPRLRFPNLPPSPGTG